MRLPKGHKWEESPCDTGCGVDYLWTCARCNATFYVNVDQGDVTTEYSQGEHSDRCPKAEA